MAEELKLEPTNACPGGLDQTIRDCNCREELPRLNKVLRAWTGNQRRSAMDQLDVLIDETGSRPCLATLKAEFQAESGDIFGAIETTQQCIEQAPDSAASLAKLSHFLTLSDDDRAIEVLLDACEKYETHKAQMEPLITSVIETALRFRSQNDYFAALAWMRIGFPYLSDESKTNISAQLQPDHRGVSCSILANLGAKSLVIPEGAEAAPTLKPYHEAIQAMSHGRFRQAVPLLEQAIEEEPQRYDAWLDLVSAHAACRNSKKACQVLETLGNKPDLPAAWKLWITSVAQWYESVVTDTPLYHKSLSWTIDDATTAMEKMHSDTSAMAAPELTPMVANVSPPPKGIFVILSGPKVTAKNATDIQPKDVPFVYGIAVVHGKQTDQAATIEIRVDAEQVDPVTQQLQAILGDLLGDRTLADAERQIPSCFRLDRNWELRELAKDDRRELIERCDHHWIHQIWTEEPHLALQGKTPREAAEDPALAEGLAAAVFQLETQVIAMGKATDFTEIRRELKIPVPESVDPWSTPLAQLALPQWSNLDLMKLGQDDAARLFAVAANFRYVGVARTLANLVLDTANDDSVQLSLSISYQMGESEYDPNESIKWYRRAGDLAEKSNQDSFMYRLLAVRMTIETAQSDLLEERLNEAVKAAGENQEHLSVLFQLLQQYGLVQQPAVPNQPAAAQPGPAKPSDGIWTPNSPAQPKSTEDGKESKLWVPGMD